MDVLEDEEWECCAECCAFKLLRDDWEGHCSWLTGWSTLPTSCRQAAILEFMRSTMRCTTEPVVQDGGTLLVATADGDCEVPFLHRGRVLCERGFHIVTGIGRSQWTRVRNYAIAGLAAPPPITRSRDSIVRHAAGRRTTTVAG